MVVSNAGRKTTPLSPTMWGVIVFAVAFLPRLFHLLSIQASPQFNYLAPDPLSCYQLASKLAAGQTVGDAILFRAPLYPYLLALYYWSGASRFH